MRNLCIAFVAAANLGLSLPAEAEVAVTLRSGRAFHGQVDSQTSDTHLWLRYGSSHATFRRGIRWDRIVQMSIDGKNVAADQRKTLAVARKREAVKLPDATARKPSPNSRPAAATKATRARVAQIRIDARLGNWDADEENDGIIVQFQPLSRSGMLIRANGTLHLSLLANRRAKFHESKRGRSPIVIRRWSIRIHPAVVGQSIQLPFGSIHPERDPRIASYGDLRASFAAPGHGVFHTRQTHVRIRPFPFAQSSSR